MRRAALLLVFAAAFVAPATAQNARTSSAFTIDQVRSFPYPNELTAAASGTRIAWAFNEQGRRNIFVAEGPAFAARQLTHYDRDDGQELSSVALSANGRWVVYVRGGDHGSNWDDGLPVNVGSNPVPPKVQIFSVPFDGGEPKAIGDGDYPVVSPRGDVVAFIKGDQIWTAPIDGSAPAKQLFTARGENSEPRWSPDGTRLAFVTDRGDHSFIGVFANDSTPIVWLAPAFARDRSPRWSPDGRRIAFVRLSAAGGAPDSLLPRHPNPWEIWTADASTGTAQQLWKSPETLAGSVPSTDGETNLGWGDGRIVFLSYQDGWPHLYSIPATGGSALLLTPGRYMAEHIALSGDGRWLVFAGNTGSDSLDIDRRHVIRVPVDRAAPEVMTPGTGLEWSPVVTGDGATLVFIGATAQRPALPAAMAFASPHGSVRMIGADHIPRDFPSGLVTPRQVLFRSADGLTIHGQLFDVAGGKNRKPAVVFVHGGPPRQMLLGWHYSDYYSNAYALNQYLAQRGFIVLSVNYRLGIGYGYEFHQPPNAGARGAAEYRDIQAAATYLRSLPQVDASRIGIYGGSYGGYLTALALARNSDMFAAGVDIHGVHDWSTYSRTFARQRYEQAPDADSALATAWHSSPVSSVGSWKSPVLLIHGDDDRNVRFSQSADLVRRLAAAGVRFETLVIPDDTHHFLRYANIVTVDKAAAAFLERQLLPGSASDTRATGRP
ncbi:MAG TPA: prolyl oligopeptidase family serine peptidase [Gemmatimonadales bacterium]|nr:prolyl oligopeptidase family serine peptidase [Gemmatimonadales bacterium]